MHRRSFLYGTGAVAAALAMPRLAHGAGARAIRFVPYVDLSLLDPVANTATPTRNHAYLVFDTLYGVDTEFAARPQMVAGHTVENGGLLWRLVLRDGLLFHDGQKVLARDAVASIRRWGARDSFGQALLDATAELTSPDDSTIQFRMRRPFALLPDALAKVSPNMCPIMPERLAGTDPAKPITEMVGSGPFRFVPDERLPGARAVYARFDGYVPRADGTPSISAGPKIAYVDRVEWITIPDAATAAAALQRGEVDWLEAPSPDLVPTLRRNEAVRVEVKDRTGLTPILRFNCIQPPFDNPAIRRAVLRAANQTEFMQAFSTDPSMWHVKLGVFCPDTPMATDVGLDELFGPTDVARGKRELAEAGYRGERVVLMSPTDHPISAPLANVADDLFRRIGLNVDTQAMDSGTMFQRRNSREPVEKGGWSCFPSMVSGINILNPAVADTARGNGLQGWYGWPTSDTLERLHTEWLRASGLDEEKRIAAAMQAEAWREATFIPAGQIYQPVAFLEPVRHPPGVRQVLQRQGRAGMTHPVWRSGLFVPVNVERFVAKASTRGADTIQLDLEDSIAPADKDAARRALPGAVERIRREGRSEVLVRINQPLELAVRDIEAAVLPGVAGLMITKVEGPDHLRLLDELVSRLEASRGLADRSVRFLALIEAPGPLLQAAAIARATPRTIALSLGAEDYATAIGGEPTEDVLLLPKQLMLQAARAAGLMPMGTIGTVADFSDMAAYAGVVRRSASFGFMGASAIHPSQVPVLNAGFSPSAEAVAQAARIVAADREAAAAGRGSFALDGKMIDIPIVQRAEALLARARLIAAGEEC